jgi:hypothetical protein
MTAPSHWPVTKIKKSPKGWMVCAIDCRRIINLVPGLPNGGL